MFLQDGAGSSGDTGPQVGGLLGDGTGDGRALGLTLRVDDHASVVLKVDEDTVLAAPRLALTNDDARHDCAAATRHAATTAYSKKATTASRMCAGSERKRVATR